MNIKAYFLLAALLVMPALAMDKKLTAENIVNHSRFLEIVKKFERVGAWIETEGNFIFIHHQCLNARGIGRGAAVWLEFANRLDSLELCYLQNYQKMIDSQVRELKTSLPKSLQGLSILAVAQAYKEGNAQVIAGVDFLPDDLKAKVLLARKI